MSDWGERDRRSATPQTLVPQESAPAEGPRDPRRPVARFGARPEDPTVRDRLAAFTHRYGWRAYALPVLVLLTLAALLSGHGPGQGAHSDAAHAPPTASGEIALKSDQPAAGSLNAVASAATLPAGAPYTVQGAGSYWVVPGQSGVVGSGTLHRYTIEIENGVTGIDPTQFATAVQTVLSDPRSWAGHGGVALQRVATGQVDFHVTLVSSMTVRRLCGYNIAIETSCFAGTDPITGATLNRVVLNDARWVRGDESYLGDLNAYRTYMINHEDGHALGHMHAHQCLPGGLAPAMMQQTIGLRSMPDGAMCQANPWPYPLGASGTPGVEAPDTPQNSQVQAKTD